ncbi:MAG TPA: undecaprenyl-diphosphatase [Ruminococcaceae bacterium]|nr:undecaprenyl-diphosphatase [Oscillospiraceae bacterium]
MQILEIIKAVILGVIEGITEWLPVSSTGHMILFNSFWPMNPHVYRGGNGQEFIDLFLIVIQLGAILAVMVLYRHRLNPFSQHKTPAQRKSTWMLWYKVFIASIPALIVGVLFEHKIKTKLYNPPVIAVALIVYGILFIVIENEHRKPHIKTPDSIDTRTAFLIGMFQALSLIPGTSRSGSTILGAILLGCARPAAAEFSFFMAIPAMIVASGKDCIQYFVQNGGGFTGFETSVLLTGMVVAFIVSVFAVKGLMKFVKGHDFKPFGWYRIVLGAVVILFSLTHVLRMS